VELEAVHRHDHDQWPEPVSKQVRRVDFTTPGAPQMPSTVRRPALSNQDRRWSPKQSIIPPTG